MNEQTITKQIAESYYITHPSCDWATFMISEKGDIMIGSDFGHTTFAWRHFSSTNKTLNGFKSFLTSLNEGYWKDKMEYNLVYMGCKKSQIKGFLSHVWPLFVVLQEQLKSELS